MYKGKKENLVPFLLPPPPQPRVLSKYCSQCFRSRYTGNLTYWDGNALPVG